MTSTLEHDLLGEPEGPPSADDVPRRIVAPVSPSDRAFRGVLYAGGIGVLAITGLIAVFLIVRAAPALSDAGFGFVTTKAWIPGQHNFGIATLLPNGVIIALIALAIALPMGFAVAIFISEYAPFRVRRTLIAIIDLMAAIPSIVYALWGVQFVTPRVLGTMRWLSEHVDWLPLFEVRGQHEKSSYAGSAMIAGIVVAILIVPLVASISREVFSQAPIGEREAAFALGATRWQMVRTVVIPFGRAGMIGAAMLGFGRALGETIVIYFLTNPTSSFAWRITEAGSNSIPALIATRYSESTPEMIASLMAAGLALFVITIAFNSLSAVFINRSRSGAQTL